MLTAALAPVLRDLRRTGGPVPIVEDRDWTNDPAAPSAMLGSADGTAAGVYATRSAAQAERVAEVAGRVQEWAIEELWRDSRTNWPPCPRHPASHPMRAQVCHGVAVWQCPADDVDVVPVGRLGG